MTLIVNLVRPIPGDNSFYSKWDLVGQTVSSLPLDKLDQIDILILDFNTILDQKIINKMTRLSVVGTPTTGLTHLAHLSFRCPIISLKNHPELYKVKSVSELTMMFILMLSRPLSAMGNTLSGKTIGILGVGRIGLQVSRLAIAFGMKVIGYDKGSMPSNLNNLIDQSDIITIHLDESPSTRLFVNERFIKQMKPESILINTARGSILDEHALVRALSNKDIKGAALDVIEDPTAFTNIRGLNLILSSHIGGSTREDRMLTEKLLFERVRYYYRLLGKKQK